MFKLKIDKAAYDALSDEHKALYIAKGDSFVIDVDDTEVAAEMRRARDREKQLKDEAEGKVADLTTRLEALEGDNNRRGNNIDAIEASWKTKLTNAETAAATKVQGLQTQLKQLLVSDVAKSLAAEISTVPHVILPHILARLQADLDGDTPVTRVLGDDGKPSALTLDELKKSFVDNKDFASIIIASKASGSGGSGGNQGGGATKQPSEYTESERVALFQSDRATYDRLFPLNG